MWSTAVSHVIAKLVLTVQHTMILHIRHATPPHIILSHTTPFHPIPPHFIPYHPIPSHSVPYHLERRSYDFPSDDTKGATTSDGKSKPSKRFSLKQGGLLDDEEPKDSASKSCCAVC